MWDLIPSWLADPSAYAQPENLDMTTVVVVALANLFFGLCCLAVYECVRRKTPRTYAPRIQLGHATPPPLPTSYPPIAKICSSSRRMSGATHCNG